MPSYGGNNLQIACGPLDQAELEKRYDSMSFTSDVLDTALWLTGPINAFLAVSSNCTDTDFTAKLTDVYPDGTSRLIQDGIVRMRWRDYTGPELMIPGQIYEVELSLWNTSYVFSAGHKLRVSISSSNYPRFSVNPNNGYPLINADNGPNVTAINTVYHSPSYLSYIQLPVVQPSQLPPFPILEHPELLGDKESIERFVMPFVRSAILRDGGKV